MSAYTSIRDAIQELGAEVVEEHFHPEAFGSAYCIFERTSPVSFRLVWDGKEGYGFLQVEKSNGAWEEIGPHVSTGSSTNPKFIELIAIVKRLLFVLP